LLIINEVLLKTDGWYYDKKIKSKNDSGAVAR
jgi:hypothetical protein